MTMWDLPKKTKGQIVSVHSSMSASLAQRLEEMGFVEGQVVKCMRRTAFQGPLVIQVQDCIYSLEKALAEQITISMS